MPKFSLAAFSTVNNVRPFLQQNKFFRDPPSEAELRFYANWTHLEPVALAMAASWGKWCRRKGKAVSIANAGKTADYAWRMKLFEHLGVAWTPTVTEHEESGRFLPVRQVLASSDIGAVIADISALLHLDSEPESLAAVQYCMSELLRNVLEHSGSLDGAFICAQTYPGKKKRVSIAVADCGIGVGAHLGRVFPDALSNAREAIRLALQPGITGAVRGAYGAPDNAGAGLFITRSIAKGCGGYFMLYSGEGAYRLRRANMEEQRTLTMDAMAERHDYWPLVENGWQGTVVALEIMMERLMDFDSYFRWIRDSIPERRRREGRIRFS